MRAALVKSSLASPRRKPPAADTCRRHLARRCSRSTREPRQLAQRGSQASKMSTSCPYTTIDNPCAVLIGTVVPSRLTFPSQNRPLVSELWLSPPSDKIGDRAGESAAVTSADPCDRHHIRTDVSIGVLPQRPFRPARWTNRPRAVGGQPERAARQDVIGKTGASLVGPIAVYINQRQRAGRHV